VLRKGGLPQQRFDKSITDSDYSFMWYQNIGNVFFLFVTKHACDGRTDRRTDVQYYGPKNAR